MPRLPPGRAAARRADGRLDHAARPVHGARPGALRRRLHDADRRRAAVGHARPPRRGARRCSPATRRCSTRARPTSILRPLVGHASVLLLDGPQHMRQRKLMLPPFHGSRMAGYEELVREIAARARRALAARHAGPLAPADAGDHARRRPARDLRRRRGRRAARRAAREPAGDARTRDQRRPSMLAMSRSGRATVERATCSSRWLEPVDALLYEQIARAPPRRPATTSSRCCSPPAHEDGEPMSDRELRDELVTLLVAGHETTATALSWTVERLVRTPGGWDGAARRRRGLRRGGREGGAAAAPGAPGRAAPACRRR